jgi:agmatinase
MKTPFNFLGIPEVEINEAMVVILGIPFEETTSYGKGTKKGPDAIVKASQQIELYNPELGEEIQELIKITTLPHFKGKRKNIEKIIAKYTDKFLISIGGEHSITPEIVKPFFKKYPNLSILQIDAHTDMRDEWEGSKNSHACAMRRIQELGIKNIVQIGIRNTAKEEQKYLKLENIFWGNKYNIDDVLNKLTNDVYLTFDVDGLDASIMPATGTPEPGGLTYDQTLEIMKFAMSKKNIVAADFVEFSPIKNIHAYDFVVAKLIFYLINYYYEKSKIR